jgi:phenylpropionate dioxygenase-like ring-hydroxylating dioxygenase large terminal subunit
MDTSSIGLDAPCARADATDLGKIVAGIAAAAAMPLERATTLPRDAYTDEAYFAHEREAVLASGWLCVAHVSQIGEPGRFVAVEAAGEPLVVTRDAANQIHVLSRVCPHRGTDILHAAFERPREGRAKRLICPYHAWSFELDGRLGSCPEMDRAKDFDPAAARLKAVRSEIWHGFVFVNLDGRASPLAEQYAAFGEIIAPWNVEAMQVAIELDWECEFNWKVLCENWMESYHHMGIHHDTLQRTMPARTTWTDLAHPHFIRCHLPFREAETRRVREAREGGTALPGFKALPGLTLEQETEWGLFLGLPTFMFLTMRDRVLWYRVEPLSASRSRLKTMTLVSRDAMTSPGFEEALVSERKMLSDFHREDMQVNTALQIGLGSRYAAQGRLSHLEEPIWHIQRYLAARLAARCPAPDAR